MYPIKWREWRQWKASRPQALFSFNISSVTIMSYHKTWEKLKGGIKEAKAKIKEVGSILFILYLVYVCVCVCGLVCMCVCVCACLCVCVHLLRSQWVCMHLYMPWEEVREPLARWFGPLHPPCPVCVNIFKMLVLVLNSQK